MSYKAVGKVWTPETLREELKKVPVPKWFKAITIHHTAAPSLTQRPKGFTLQHIINIRDFYINKKHWDRGPHFFVDEDQIFGMTPVTEKGIHAASFNSFALGIETLGDYDSEDPKSGRGLACWTECAKLVNVLCEWAGIVPTEKTILFHREDPKTSKTCPGTKVNKTWVLDLIKQTSSSSTPTPITLTNLAIPITITKAGSKETIQGTLIADKVFIPVRSFMYFCGVSKELFENKFAAKKDKYYYDNKLMEQAFFNADKNTVFAWIREVLPFTNLTVQSLNLANRTLHLDN